MSKDSFKLKVHISSNESIGDSACIRFCQTSLFSSVDSWLLVPLVMKVISYPAVGGTLITTIWFNDFCLYRRPLKQGQVFFFYAKVGVSVAKNQSFSEWMASLQDE